MVGDVTKSGLHIGETVAKAGLDLTGSVVVGTVGASLPNYLSFSPR
jgi:hypothetical protein